MPQANEDLKAAAVGLARGLLVIEGVAFRIGLPYRIEIRVQVQHEPVAVGVFLQGLRHWFAPFLTLKISTIGYVGTPWQRPCSLLEL
jgi:hypothetical protein